MDNELTKALAEKFNTTFEYAKQYLPDLMDRYINYEIISTIILMCIFVAIITFTIFFVPYVYKHMNNEKSIWYVFDDLATVPCVVFIVASILSLLFFVACIFDLVELYTVPEIYMIEHLLNN